MTNIIDVQTPEFIKRLKHRQNSNFEHIWQLLDQIKDPEIPIISLWDLGILQDVRVDNSLITIVITPTYSGCPAMEDIEAAIKDLLISYGFDKFRILLQLSPAWTTQWMSAEGRNNLRDYGISPPLYTNKNKCSNHNNEIACPQCQSTHVVKVSEFGSTSCKSLYQCKRCLEPFDYFKCI